MGTATVWQALVRPPWRFLFGGWPWRVLCYLLASIVITLLQLVVTIATLFFLPLWGILLGVVERRRTRLLGFARQASSHVRVQSDQRHNWLGIRVSEAATWRELAGFLVDLVFGAASFALVCFEVFALVVLGGVTYLITQRPVDVRLWGDAPVHWEDIDVWQPALLFLAALIVFAYTNALVTGLQATALRPLVGPRERELDRNIARLTRSRAVLVEAFEAERRRIERDLHDGVQQELVTVAARLGLVGLEVADLEARGVDVGALRDAVEAAREQNDHATARLRETVRGIHPAVLTDHGLAAALDELAGRTPLPLRVTLSEFGRLPAPVEVAAYYLVTEAVTNAAKHTDASRMRVTAGIETGALRVSVSDNGRGGADESAGTGLGGLRERAETLGGSFAVESPPGGPTTLTMVLPIIREGAHAAPAR